MSCRSYPSTVTLAYHPINLWYSLHLPFSSVNFIRNKNIIQQWHYCFQYGAKMLYTCACYFEIPLTFCHFHATVLHSLSLSLCVCMNSIDKKLFSFLVVCRFMQNFGIKRSASSGYNILPGCLPFKANIFVCLSN